MERKRIVLRTDKRSYLETDRYSRKEAAELGLSVYWTGKPCAKGHVVHRRIQNGHCIECIRLWRIGYEARKSVGKFKKEASSLGIDPDKRRSIEDLRESIRLAKELEDLS